MLAVDDEVEAPWSAASSGSDEAALLESLLLLELCVLSELLAPCM